MYVFGNDRDELGFCGAGEGRRRIPWPCQEHTKQLSYFSKEIKIAIEVPIEKEKALQNNRQIQKTTRLIPEDAKPCSLYVLLSLFHSGVFPSVGFNAN